MWTVSLPWEARLIASYVALVLAVMLYMVLG
jgi:hypothetical protein